jgi:hypothetical protein
MREFSSAPGRVSGDEGYVQLFMGASQRRLRVRPEPGEVRPLSGRSLAEAESPDCALAPTRHRPKFDRDPVPEYPSQML